MLRFALLMLVSCAVGPVWAQAQQPAPLQSFDVELVIFHFATPTGSPEEWSLEEKNGAQKLAIEDEEKTAETPGSASATASTVPAASAAFPTLPASRLKLSGSEDALKRNRNYKPIVHLGWTQPGFGTQGAQSVPVDATGPDGSRVYGQVTLVRERYLHLSLNLVYEPPAGAPDAGHRYVIRQSRRMRSTERHYIDHPHFGVVALINPTPQTG
jgi:hypothetical protein